MADEIPLKVRRTAGDTDALAEMEVGESVGLDHGGTGAVTAGAALGNLGGEPANANIQAHIVDTANPHAVSAAQVGAEPANANIQAHIADTANPHLTPTFPLEVEDEGVSLTVAAAKINFAGAGVTATEPVADEILVTIPGGGGGAAAEFADYYANAATTITGAAVTVGLDVNRQETAAFTRSGDEVTINTDGDYGVQYDVTLDEIAAPPATIEAWLELNSVEIAGTRGRIYHDDPDEEGSTHAFIIPSLVNTDVIRIRAQRVNGAQDCDTHANGVRLSFFSIGANGPPGPTGPPGAGSTVIIEDEGGVVAGGPHDTLNFIGAGVVASDAGGGTADVTIPGSEPVVTEASATGITTTTSGSDVLVPGMTITPGPGNYKVEFNTSWENSGAEDMFVSIYVNGVQIPHTERITEMESSITDAELACVTHGLAINVLAAQAIEIRFRTTGGTLTMLNRTMLVTKVT